MAVECKDISFSDDIDIVNGDFKLVDSEGVHIQRIIEAEKGFFFEYPLIGVGIKRELNGSTSRQAIKQDIRRQLVYDDYNVKALSLVGDDININAIRLK